MPQIISLTSNIAISQPWPRVATLTLVPKGQNKPTHGCFLFLLIYYCNVLWLFEWQDFRKRLRKYAHLASSLERTKAYEAREHLHGICQAFARFLDEATGFYSSLLRRFEAMQHQYSKSGGGGSGPDGVPVAGNSERRSRLGKIVILSINRCFIFLGDLARYRELHGENSVKDWSVAERYYQQVRARRN